MKFCIARTTSYVDMYQRKNPTLEIIFFFSFHFKNDSSFCLFVDIWSYFSNYNVLVFILIIEVWNYLSLTNVVHRVTTRYVIDSIWSFIKPKYQTIFNAHKIIWWVRRPQQIVWKTVTRGAPCERSLTCLVRSAGPEAHRLFGIGCKY